MCYFSAMLGYGYRAEDFWRGVHDHKPHAIVNDSGSTDGGSYKLGMGKMTCARSSYERDLEPMLAAAFHHGVKVLISSAGGSGSNKHVDGIVSIIEDLSKKHGYSFKLAKIYAGVKAEVVKQKIRAGVVQPCGPVEPLTEETVDKATDIVAQMGADPYMAALRTFDPDIIIGGRSYDPAPFAAFSMFHGVQPATAWHCGKIMECGGMCAIPKGRTMLATLHRDSFDLLPMNPAERCTKLSVAAHTLYEKTRPDILPGPGGRLHLDGASYEELADGRSVRVRGASFEEVPYTVKLEGAEMLGYRTTFIGGVRDPILIHQIDGFLQSVHDYTSNLFPDLQKREESCQLLWHVYGKNAVMGPIMEPCKDAIPHEVGVMGEVMAPTQELADAIASSARTSCLHMPYANQLATTGNFASPLTPLEQPLGPVYKFSLYHLMEIDNPADWPKELVTINGTAKKDPTSTLALAPVASIKKAVEPITTTVSRTINGSAEDNTLRHLAKVVRSKNSGPFEITLDVMFTDAALFHRTRQSGVLSIDTVCRLYSVDPSNVIWEGWFEPALAWKCTIKRPWRQGSVGERDTLGTAQHAPLLDIQVPLS